MNDTDCRISIIYPAEIGPLRDTAIAIHDQLLEACQNFLRDGLIRTLSQGIRDPLKRLEKEVTGEACWKTYNGALNGKLFTTEGVISIRYVQSSELSIKFVSPRQYR